MKRLFIASAVAVLLAFNAGTQAHAQAVPEKSRTINMLTQIKDLDGKPVMDPTSRPAGVKADDDPTLCEVRTADCRKVVSNALFAVFPDEQNLDWRQRWQRAVLAESLEKDMSATIAAGDVAVIERLVSKAGYSGLVLARVVQTIDPDVKPIPLQ